MSIDEIMTIIGATVGLIIWLVRLEGKVNSIDQKADISQKQIDALQIKHDALDCKIVEKLGELSESLARIEGRLGLERE